MRHKRRGRKLGRNSAHRKALLRNLACALILTEKDFDPELDENVPKVKGRIITTLPKAKEVRPFLERCITIARRALKHEEAARQFETDAPRGSEAWRQWRQSDQWRQWVAARAPAVAARRRVLRLLANKEAVRILFEKIAPRYQDRPGGYTRIVRLAKPRLGDAGTRAILELVGVRDRVVRRGPRPKLQRTATPPASEAPEAAAKSAADSAAQNAPATADSAPNAES